MSGELAFRRGRGGDPIPDAHETNRGAAFDAQEFLDAIADAHKRRDAAALRSFFALADGRFGVFEEFTEELLKGESYGNILDEVDEAGGTISFEIKDSSRFGDYAMIQALLAVVDPQGPEGFGQARIRATVLVAIREGHPPQIVAGHFSSIMCCFPKPVGVYPRGKQRKGPRKRNGPP